jgi:AraC-like DNA-binding protein
MKTIKPTGYLSKDSWSEDFTPSEDTRNSCLYVQCIGHYQAGPGYMVSRRHNLHSYLILYTMSGTGILEYMGKKEKLNRGNIALIDCTYDHSYYPEINTGKDDLWNFKWIHFYGNCIDGYLKSITDNFMITEISDCDDLFNQIYNELHKVSYSSNIACSTLLINLCSQYLINIKKCFQGKEKRISPIVRDAANIIEERFSSELALDDLCKELNISKYYLAHLFKEQIGYSPYEYLLTKRLSFAKSLLRGSDKSVSEISELCGFSKSSYFIQLFKKNEHTTPLQYRKYFRAIP